MRQKHFKLRKPIYFTNKNTFFFFVSIFLPFLGQHPQHMEVPRLGVESELQLLAYTTATATPDPSHICNLHHSSQKCWILAAEQGQGSKLQPHGSGFAVTCGVGRRCGLDPMLLWLWCRPAAAAPIPPLARELPYATGVTLKRIIIIIIITITKFLLFNLVFD